MSFEIKYNKENQPIIDNEELRSLQERKLAHYCHSDMRDEKFIFECSEDEYGKLDITANGEYCTGINFCPFCGYKSKVAILKYKGAV